MNKENENKLVPKLRFPEFIQEKSWETQPLGKISKLVRGPFGGALKKEIFVKNGFAVYEQFHAIYEDFSSFRYHVDEEKFSELKRFAVAGGDLIMSCSGTMGKFAKIPQNFKQGVINQALLKLTIKENKNIDFIKISLELPINQEKLLSQSAGGAIKNVVSVDQIRELDLSIPTPKEQQKIADCLSTLDDLIGAETEKLDALKQHKKGLMQQLFPAEGEKLPKLRFPEFKDSGDWEIDALCSKEVAEFINKKVDFGKLNIATYVSTENLLPNYAGVETSAKLPSSGSFTEYGKEDILVSNIRPYLKKVWFSDRDGTTSNDVIVIRAKAKLNSSFLSHLLINDIFIDYIMKSAEGVKMPRGDKDAIRKYQLVFPKKEEQQKIANCLSSLDEQILTQTKKIEDLKLHKKGLMQGLFPHIN